MSERRTTKATTDFLKLVLPATDPLNVWGHPARPIVWAAFHLYELEWKGRDIREWVWPFQQARHACVHTNPFRDVPAGRDNPWTILFAHAMDMIIAEAKPGE